MIVSVTSFTHVQEKISKVPVLKRGNMTHLPGFPSEPVFFLNIWVVYLLILLKLNLSNSNSQIWVTWKTYLCLYFLYHELLPSSLICSKISCSSISFWTWISMSYVKLKFNMCTWNWYFSGEFRMFNKSLKKSLLSLASGEMQCKTSLRSYVSVENGCK